MAEAQWDMPLEQRMRVLGAKLEEGGGEWSINKLIEDSRKAPVSSVLGSGLASFAIKQRELQGFPDWLKWALRTVFGPRPLHTSAVDLFFNEHVVMKTNVVTIAGSEPKSERKVATPEAHPSWRAVRACRRFATEPSASTLAAACRSLMVLSNNKWRARLASGASWPLATIVRSAESEEDLELFAAEIEQGLFGDLKQWLAAEKRWTEDGIHMCDIQYTNSLGRPFDKCIDAKGYPAGGLRRSEPSLKVDDVEEWTDELVAILSSSENPAVESDVGSWLTQLVFHEGIGAELRPHEVELLVRQQIRQGYGVNLYFVFKLLSNLGEAARKAVMPQLAGAVNLDSGYIGWIMHRGVKPEQLLSTIESAFLENPTQEGLLILIAHAARAGVKTSLSTEVLLGREFRRPEVEACSKILAIVTNATLSLEQASSLCHAFLGVLAAIELRKRTNLLMILLDAVEHDVPVPLESHVLATIYEELDDLLEGVRDAQIVERRFVGRMNGTLMRRTSGLHTVERQEELELKFLERFVP
jgi:hypothetical protein